MYHRYRRTILVRTMSPDSAMKFSTFSVDNSGDKSLLHLKIRDSHPLLPVGCFLTIFKETYKKQRVTEYQFRLRFPI